MVGEDDIHPQLGGLRHFCDAANAAVDRDQQVGALGGDRFQRLDIQTVAFIHPVGDVGAYERAGALQGGGHEDRGGDAVGIEIPVDADHFTGLDGLYDARHGRRHIGQAKRVLLYRVLDLQEGLYCGPVLETAIVQHLQQRRMLMVDLQEALRRRRIEVPVFVSRRQSGFSTRRGWQKCTEPNYSRERKKWGISHSNLAGLQ